MRPKPSIRLFFERFPNEDACWNHLRTARWGTGFDCPRCHERDRWTFLASRKKFQCNTCHYQCSVTAGTILQDTKLSLQTWFLALFLVATAKKGITQPDLARKLGIADNTAHYLAHKVMHILENGATRRLFSFVEIDEAHLGGKRTTKGPGPKKTRETVLCAVEGRGQKMGHIHLERLPRTEKTIVQGIIRQRVTPGALVRTDGSNLYGGLDEYHHQAIKNDPKHPGRQIPRVHLVISNLKRVMHAVHTHCAPGTMQSYLTTFAYRFAYREDLDLGFRTALNNLTRTNPYAYSKIRAATA